MHNILMLLEYISIIIIDINNYIVYSTISQWEYFNYIGCESSAPFCNLQSRAQAHAVLVIGLYELIDPTT